ncbi:expressed unknown protein [Seminavis robusta]|uniref:Uncharacterized protein n=1 Tax=Seminavis robusta TaxID=568900 RepID=A0A9N8EZ06_9STRA|nr:expressed unknown protein [Seminavis robusta]|eukprot:Sro2253_g320890.1 n/a (311) ;mRNA; r:5519-6451
MRRERDYHDDPLVPVEIGGRPRANQNPLRMLELLMKGFCPTIIQDRVEVHEEPLSSTAPMRSNAMGNKTAMDNTTTTGDDTSAEPTNEPEELVHPEEQLHHPYFEIAERPPSDVIGISKAIWEGFCHHNEKQQSTQHRGFCAVLTEQYCHYHNDEAPPDGEECSLDSSSEDATVDLSPQCHPLVTREFSLEYHYQGDEDPPFLVMGSDHSESDWEDEEEEDMPIAEYYHSHKRRNRALQVLISTLLFVAITFALLQTLDTGHDKNFHFAVQRKEPHTTTSSGLGFAESIRVSKRGEATQTSLVWLVPSAH